MKAQKFKEAARAAFDPIADRYHMVFHETHAGSVEYDNNTVRLSIGYDYGRSCELSVSISIMSGEIAEMRSGDLGEILGMKGAAEADMVSKLQIADENNLRPFLLMLAELLMEHAAEFLKGSRDAFKQLAQYCDQRNHRYSLEQRLSYVRADAEKAWKAHNYGGVIRALESIKNHLTPAELLRLDYARKKDA